MAYNRPPTYVTGDTFTAANANTYWRDNFAAGIPDIFEAAGDLAYASGADAAVRLAVGSARKVLTVSSTDSAPEWSNKFPSGCLIARNANQSIPTASYTKIQFDAETLDTDSYWSSTDSDSVFSPFAGIYQLTGTVNFAFNTTGTRYLGLGGLPIIATPADTSSYTILNFCYVYNFAAAHDIYMEVYQNSGGNLNVTVTYQVVFLGEA